MFVIYFGISKKSLSILWRPLGSFRKLLEALGILLANYKDLRVFGRPRGFRETT